MSKRCPHCLKELPPMTQEDFEFILEQLIKNKDLMRRLGYEAGQRYIADLPKSEGEKK